MPVMTSALVGGLVTNVHRAGFRPDGSNTITRPAKETPPDGWSDGAPSRSMGIAYFFLTVSVSVVFLWVSAYFFVTNWPDPESRDTLTVFLSVI